MRANCRHGPRALFAQIYDTVLHVIYLFTSVIRSSTSRVSRLLRCPQRGHGFYFARSTRMFLHVIEVVDRSENYLVRSDVNYYVTVTCPIR